MTAWVIASVPIWIMAVFWFLGAIVAVPCRKPHESNLDLSIQVMLGFTLSAICGMIAAWMVS